MDKTYKSTELPHKQTNKSQQNGKQFLNARTTSFHHNPNAARPQPILLDKIGTPGQTANLQGDHCMAAGDTDIARHGLFSPNNQGGGRPSNSWPRKLDMNASIERDTEMGEHQHNVHGGTQCINGTYLQVTTIFSFPPIPNELPNPTLIPSIPQYILDAIYSQLILAGTRNQNGGSI